MNVTYISACFDSSGYAEASRNNIGALDSVGVEVIPIPLSFEEQKPNIGELGKDIKKMLNRQGDPKIQIIHATPENFPRFLRPSKYNIGYTTWETSKLPEHWVPLINKLNEVWVPCSHNEYVFKKSGITIPIKVVPHTFRKEELTIEAADDILPNRNLDDFMFYSIFQWTERKNPVDLLRAYLTEFTNKDPVVLVIKSYFMNPENPAESTQMKEMISSVKKRLYLSNYPKILLISSLLSREQILALHAAGDAYVSLHRCEGFGIPVVEAMSAGKPCIVTNYGGPSDFGFGQDPTCNGIAVDYQMTPCFGMPWPLYTGHMEWANPDVMHAKRAMRYLFDNRESAKKIGENAKQWVESNLSWEQVGTLMKQRLEEIESGL